MVPAAQPFWTLSDRIVLAGPDALSDAAALEDLGIVRAICVSAEGRELPESARRWPCEAVSVELGGQSLSQRLVEGAEQLQRAVTLAAASDSAPDVVPDTEPGDSTDSEADASVGTRMRLRLRRSGDERWGIKWHQEMFKKSNRFVVDDVTEDSAVARWNGSQPSHAQVRYGDRLLRVNGVRADRGPAKQQAAKMRAELQGERIRALLWRPGGGPPAQGSAPARQTSRRVLVYAAELGALPAAAGMVALHMLQGASLECGGLAAVLGPAADAVAGPGALAVIEALEPAAPLADSPAEECDLGDQREEPAVRGVESAECAAERGAGALVEAGEKPTRSDPAWTYSCRKCSRVLFHDINVLPHFTDGVVKASRRDWALAQKEDEGGTGMPHGSCTSVFVEPMEWMGSLDGQTGRLVCGNANCRQKLGAFSWHGLPCSCGQWQCPAFQIHCARVDCVPFRSRPSRGPAPKAVESIAVF